MEQPMPEAAVEPEPKIAAPQAPEIYTTSDMVKAAALLAGGHAYRCISFKGRMGFFSIAENPEAECSIAEILQRLSKRTHMIEPYEFERRYSRIRYYLFSNLRTMKRPDEE